MSVKAMGAVWDADLERPEKFVLLAYADHAAHDGTNIYPSVERMAWKTGYTERSVQKITRELEGMGVLVPCGRGPNGVNKYRMNFNALPTRPPFKGGEEFSGGVKKTASGGEEFSPKPSEPSLEPSCTSSNEDRLYDRYPKARNTWDLYVEALAEVCSVDIGTAPKDEMGKIYQSARILRDNERNPATPAQIIAFKEWWYEEHWIGRDKGEPPRPSQVRKEWGRFTDSLQEKEDPNSGWEWA